MDGYILFAFGMVALALVAVSLPDTSRSERQAETLVCREMAKEVLAGNASRFDYMAIRCKAQFLVQD